MLLLLPSVTQCSHALRLAGRWVGLGCSTCSCTAEGSDRNHVKPIGFDARTIVLCHLCEKRAKTKDFEALASRSEAVNRKTQYAYVTDVLKLSSARPPHDTTCMSPAPSGDELSLLRYAFKVGEVVHSWSHNDLMVPYPFNATLLYQYNHVAWSCLLAMSAHAAVSSSADPESSSCRSMLQQCYSLSVGD